MSLNETPRANRLHISLFGKRNAGKSSLINALTAQNLAIVSDVAGTTTDPVYKSMELLPIGPVVLIDTPGLDDEGELGKMRVQKSYDVLNKTDVALLVTGANETLTPLENTTIEKFKEKQIPYLIVHNKLDLLDKSFTPPLKENEIWISALNKYQIDALKEKIAKISAVEKSKPIVSDLLTPDDLVILVVPIDSGAPKGRLILPQQQTIRDIIDGGALALTLQEPSLEHTLNMCKDKVRLVITDSQIFKTVAQKVPSSIPLTSFSILMARYKGILEQAVQGAVAIDTLKNGDKVLICEGCTHHRQCEDIGTVKLPRWIEDYTKKEIIFDFTSGGSFKDNLEEYALIVHCGGCMLNEKEMSNRQHKAQQQNIPFTNYGILIAYLNGILPRVVSPFKDISNYLQK